MDEKTLKARLLKENPEFHDAHAQHQDCETRLEGYSRKTYLSEQDRQTVRELKKKKLALKDKMYIIMAKYRRIADRSSE